MKRPEIAPDDQEMWLARSLTFCERMNGPRPFVLGRSIAILAIVAGMTCGGRNGAS